MTDTIYITLPRWSGFYSLNSFYPGCIQGMWSCEVVGRSETRYARTTVATSKQEISTADFDVFAARKEQGRQALLQFLREEAA